jgi:very-short-patch-repair endonuclease
MLTDVDQTHARLLAGPFLGSAAIRCGALTRAQLRNESWRRLLRDVYVHRDLEISPLVRASAVALVIPTGGVVSGRTAAWLYGGLAPLPTDPVEITLPRDIAMGPRTGLRIRHALLAEQDTTTIADLPVTTVERTAFDIARLRRPRHAKDLTEAVVALDALARLRRFDPTDLTKYAARHRGWRGVRLVAEAAGLVDPGAESPMETRLRLTLVLGGLPRPVSQHKIYDSVGRFVARVDLAYPDLRVAIEYDGEDHKDRWADDMVRQNRIIGAGWTLMRYTNGDVSRRPTTIVTQVDAARCAALAA